LCDGIYPDWAVLVRPIQQPADAAQSLFTKIQEGVRKDSERTFGVLFSRFEILANPGRYWGLDKMTKVWRTCVILHNMIVESERDNYATQFLTEAVDSDIRVMPALSRPASLNEVWERMKEIRSSDVHYQLRSDLIQHLQARQLAGL